MGCFSSKIISRSISFREQLNPARRQKSAKRIPPLPEIAVSVSIDDQILALVSTADAVASKLRSGSIPKTSIEPYLKPEDQRGGAKQEEPENLLLLPKSPGVDVLKRSKSCSWFPANEIPSPFMETSHEAKEGSIGRARSFHTVEEYDALLEKIRLAAAKQVGSHGQDNDPINRLQLSRGRSLNSSLNPEDSATGTGKIQQSNSNDDFSLEQKCMNEKDRKSIAALETPTTATALNAVKNCAQASTLEKVSKRKSLAVGLQSLEIPPSVEFRTVASLREWLKAGGQVYSPGTCATPKFGSNPSNVLGTANESSEGVIFNPELVASFEESMQQLEAEAESILEQITENLNGENNAVTKPEDSLSHTNESMTRVCTKNNESFNFCLPDK